MFKVVLWLFISAMLGLMWSVCGLALLITFIKGQQLNSASLKSFWELSIALALMLNVK
jgi:hypothetical protein